MSKIGIMQGRLVPSKGRGIQFFPFEEWREEFKKGKEVGIGEIEWVFDYDNYKENPLWTKSGQEEIKSYMRIYGIQVNSVCWDYFMRRPFYKYDADRSGSILEENKEIMQRTLEAMHEIEASLIEIPMVDDSSVKNEMGCNAAISFLKWVCDLAADYGITVGLETDFPPEEFRKFLDNVGKNNIVANYDCGNSSGLGYNHRDELLSLGKYVYNVHIKDRVKGNGTVKLGTGSADFEAVFGALKEIGYKNSFILQAARGEDGYEVQTIKEQIFFVKKYLDKYQI